MSHLVVLADDNVVRIKQLVALSVTDVVATVQGLLAGAREEKYVDQIIFTAQFVS